VLHFRALEALLPSVAEPDILEDMKTVPEADQAAELFSRGFT
jgi:hypothetical protein